MLPDVRLALETVKESVMEDRCGPRIGQHVWPKRGHGQSGTFLFVVMI